jgi:N-acetylglucosaminyldiphosphoundecaprenol N-acetyl-beta-D-mannosaminyltransferase
LLTKPWPAKLDRQEPPPRTVAELLPKIRLHGVWVHAVTERDCVRTVFREIDGGRGGFVHTVNLDLLRRIVSDAEFARICGATDIRTADGAPLVWASRLQGTPLPERVSGSSLIWSLSEAAAEQRRSVFFLGGAPGTADNAARSLSTRYPGLRVAGICSPVVERGTDPLTHRRLSEIVVAAKPDIVYVALGSPKTEELIDGLRADLPTCWWIGVGIAFSFVSGDVRRAPRWVQRAGLEWLHRLVQEPRLTKRYLVDGVPFAVTLLAGSLATRILDIRSR